MVPTSPPAGQRSILPLTVVFILVLAAASQRLAAQDWSPRQRPNVLWIVSEDNSASWLGCYGNRQATTPNLDRLATEGFRYTRLFANAPVCAPQRSSWILGMPALTAGTHPMRSDNRIPDSLRYYSEHLQEAGYWTHNSRKTDYNIGGRSERSGWNSSGDRSTPWRKAPEDRPFFCIVNIDTCHERFAFEGLDDTEHDPAAVQAAAYHPDLEVTRANYARYHDRISRMDAEVGRILEALAEDGLAETTIVAYCSDHGGVMPRSKRFLFSAGLHMPLIMRIPQRHRSWWPAVAPGQTVDDLVSAHDLTSTWLALAGVERPATMSGRALLGPNRGEPRRWHVAFRERMDEVYDNARAVTDGHFLYVRSYLPWAPWGQHLDYLWRLPLTQAWEEHHRAGRTDAITGRFFRPRARSEELYDLARDPDCVHNLIDEPAQQERLDTMRQVLREWQIAHHDPALLPEVEWQRLLAEHGGTIYELARDPGLHPVADLLDAADRAMARDPANAEQMRADLVSSQPGLRWWAVIGLLLLDDAQAQALLLEALEDEAHAVRIMAAWALLRQNAHRDAAIACWRELLNGDSYASLLLYNCLRWAGPEAADLVPDIRRAIEKDPGGYESRIATDLLAGPRAREPAGR